MIQKLGWVILKRKIIFGICSAQWIIGELRKLEEKEKSNMEWDRGTSTAGQDIARNTK